MRIAQPWRPYASIACWYCWQSLKLPESPKEKSREQNLPVA
jgi:3-methyladenine DNA glycosylase/8-oxoguanine DNA glycosylase